MSMHLGQMGGVLNDMGVVVTMVVLDSGMVTEWFGAAPMTLETSQKESDPDHFTPESARKLEPQCDYAQGVNCNQWREWG